MNLDHVYECQLAVPILSFFFTPLHPQDRDMQNALALSLRGMGLFLIYLCSPLVTQLCGRGFSLDPSSWALLFFFYY